MATIQDAIEGIQDVMLTVSGIKGAPDYPPEKLGGLFPLAITFASEGEWSDGPAQSARALHNIIIEVHCARRDMQYDVEKAVTFGDTVPLALIADRTLGGVVDTFGDITYRFGAMKYGDDQSIGWRFVVEDIKIITEV